MLDVLRSKSNYSIQGLWARPQNSGWVYYKDYWSQHGSCRLSLEDELRNSPKGGRKIFSCLCFEDFLNSWYPRRGGLNVWPEWRTELWKECQRERERASMPCLAAEGALAVSELQRKRTNTLTKNAVTPLQVGVLFWTFISCLIWRG